MELVCPACFRALQIAEEHAGQVVKCPHCAATFQAPYSPGMPPLLLPPGAGAPSPSEVPAASSPAPFSMAPVSPVPNAAAPAQVAGEKPILPDTPLSLAPEVPVAPKPQQVVAPGPYNLGPAPTPSPPTPVLPTPPLAPPAPKPAAKGEYKRSFTIHLRREVVFLIAPLGLIAVFFLSFFPWHRDPRSTLILWQLAFGNEGMAPFQWIVLLLFGAAAATALGLMLERGVIPASPAVRSRLSGFALLAGLLAGAGWALFLLHYLWCNFVPAINPATLSMKLAIRIHFFVMLGALMDFWLQRRARKQLPEPRVKVRW